MDVLFCDIDGVLNRAGYGEDTYADRFENGDLALDADCVENLKSLLGEFPDLKIVWSTDWRFCEEPLWRGEWRNPRLWLESRDWMSGRVAGKTPCKMSSEHFHDIKWWLDANPGVSRYAILEDSYFPEDWFGIEKHLVRCDPSAGLTRENAAEVARILKGQA